MEWNWVSFVVGASAGGFLVAISVLLSIRSYEKNQTVKR